MKRRVSSVVSALGLLLLTGFLAPVKGDPSLAQVPAASPEAGACFSAATPAGTPAEATPADATLTPEPVDEAMLDQLVIADAPISTGPFFAGVSLAALPGQTRPLGLGALDSRHFVEPVTVAATWSVAPADCAHIDAATGVLTIDPHAPHGSVFTVTAEIEGGRRQVSIAVHVFTPEANPLVGLWREQARVACDDGGETAPAEPIEELVFGADGTFTVTWIPFETYVDYWGTYAYDLAAGTLELTVDGGNQIPPDVDGAGRFAFLNGDLVLTDLWLGTPPQSGEEVACGHRFAG